MLFTLGLLPLWERSLHAHTYSLHTLMALSGQERPSFHSHQSNLIVGVCFQGKVLGESLTILLHVVARNPFRNQLTTLIFNPRSRPNTQYPMPGFRCRIIKLATIPTHVNLDKSNLTTINGGGHLRALFLSC